MTYEDIYKVIDSYAPFVLSKELCEFANMYDNSGAILKTDSKIEAVCFTLDLSVDAIQYAVNNGCQLIVTHHPAIYTPLKSISGALLKCAKLNIGVISAHLNMDTAKEGIDYFQAKGLGAIDCKCICTLPSGGRYGSVFSVDKTLEEIYVSAKKEFNTDKIRVYGDMNKKIKTIASFCGAGLDDAGLQSGADLFVSADVPHHTIVHILSEGKALMDLSHYGSENYGFKRVYQNIVDKALFQNIKLYYFDDLRF